MLNQGKTARYFKYAIGEIILVVIGILIALQINNWNSQRHERNQEQLILESLRASFIENLKTLIKAKTDTKKVHAACLELLALIHPTQVNYTNDEVDSLLSQILHYYTWDATTGAFNQVINSGQFNIIQSKEIKIKVSNWSRLITDSAKDINISNDHLFKSIVLYLSQHANIKNMPIPESIYANTKLPEISHSNFDADYIKMMSSKEFENLIDWQAINLFYIVNEYEKIQTYLETTLQLIEAEIKT
jgi:hypothetical protein